MNAGGQVGGTTTPGLTPFVAKHFGWDMPFWVTAGLCFPGALAWLVVDPEQLGQCQSTNGRFERFSRKRNKWVKEIAE